MKILHIIGNGFDLNLGLKTSYKDFYDYYASIESPKESITNLKNSISNNYKNWSDLELAFGQYTQEIKTSEFDEIFEDIINQLAEYLRIEEKRFNLSGVNNQKFFADLAKPEMFLPAAERDLLVAYKNKFSNHSWYVDIVTFNYTSIIENIIKSKNPVKIGNHMRSDLPVTLRGVDHIHGYIDDRMVFGVNDISQLKNQDFHNNIDILEAVVKEKCNQAQGHNVDTQFKNKIKQADIISIFGASLGDSDNIWWEQIGSRMKSAQIPVLIFTKGEEVISPRLGYKSSRTKREIRDYFINKTKLNSDDRKRISSNIFIGLDTQMFKQISM